MGAWCFVCDAPVEGGAACSVCGRRAVVVPDVVEPVSPGPSLRSRLFALPRWVWLLAALAAGGALFPVFASGFDL